MASTAEQHYRQGMALHAAGDFAAALAAFDAALQTAPPKFFKPSILAGETRLSGCAGWKKR